MTQVVISPGLGRTEYRGGSCTAIAVCAVRLRLLSPPRYHLVSGERDNDSLEKMHIYI